ncbi:unannotated protein [freshwater metagenome]|uniref:Unannotated protein n=1 Tax=freshwater metagenome TaxID=449393 RepID=A0A6J7RB23_9ZZZZ
MTEQSGTSKPSNTSDPGSGGARSVGPAVEVVGLTRSFGGVRALDGLSFLAPRGAITAVLGPNGAGKTTTLEICEGYQTADSGTVSVLGLDPRRDGAELRQRVGVMLQSGGIPPGASASEMLKHVARLYAHPLDTRALSSRLGIDGLGRTAYRRLSGGEQRRVAFALSIIGRPELVFLDEPTTGLDPQARAAVWDLARELSAAGVSIVLTTHLLEEAERVADHVVIIDHGRVVAAGSVNELVEASGGSQIVLRTEPGLALGSLIDMLPNGCAVTESTPGRYVVDGSVDMGTTQLVGQWCRELGVAPLELGLRARSLEDVFLDLTGRELRT